MARLIFCFFAEDTDAFYGHGLFTASVDQMSAKDATNIHEVIAEILRAMNTPIAGREAAGNRFNNDLSYANQMTVEIEPAADSLVLIQSAIRAARAM